MSFWLGEMAFRDMTMVKRVLVVDDSKTQRMIMMRALAEFSCEIVGEAEDGQQATEMAARLSPDVIFLDMEMPGLTGLQALKAIKAVNPKIVIFMVTSIDSSDVIDDCIMAGAEDYIRKDRLETLRARAGGFLK